MYYSQPYGPSAPVTNYKLDVGDVLGQVGQAVVGAAATWAQGWAANQWGGGDPSTPQVTPAGAPAGYAPAAGAAGAGLALSPALLAVGVLAAVLVLRGRG